jgi:hypothetical protein
VEGGVARVHVDGEVEVEQDVGRGDFGVARRPQVHERRLKVVVNLLKKKI